MPALFMGVTLLKLLSDDISTEVVSVFLAGTLLLHVSDSRFKNDQKPELGGIH